MKIKVSISIEEQTFKNVEKKVEEGTFRNKNHVVEFAVNKFLKELEDEN